MNFLNKIIFFIFFYLFTAFFAILSIPLVLFPRKYISYSLMIWSNFMNYLLYFLFKIDYKIYGKINTNQVIYAIATSKPPLYNLMTLPLIFLSLSVQCNRIS